MSSFGLHDAASVLPSPELRGRMSDRGVELIGNSSA